MIADMPQHAVQAKLVEAQHIQGGSTTFDAQLEDLDTQIAAVCERIPHLKGQLLQNDANIKSLLQLAVCMHQAAQPPVRSRQEHAC